MKYEMLKISAFSTLNRKTPKNSKFQKKNATFVPVNRCSIFKYDRYLGFSR